MSSPTASTVSLPTAHPDAIQAIVHGYHGNPFDILGPHPYDNGFVVRAFLPQASAVELVTTSAKSQRFSMTRVYWDGFFEVFLPRRKKMPAYQLEIVTPDSRISLYEDPYAFPMALLTEYDHYLLGEGTHIRMYEKMGAHLAEIEGRTGVNFAVWAPNARRVSVIGAFNNWDGRRHPMRFHPNTGIWELFIPGLGEGTLYKYEIKAYYQNYRVAKADPVGFYSEVRPKTASIVWDINKYEWRDQEWMGRRDEERAEERPMSVYEVHLGSWRRKNNNEWLTYEELTRELIPYVKEMGYTHVELLPVAEHPYDGSWGYQVTGYFAPTSRFGTPEQFMAFVDDCHQAGIGVILDWVPAHFPTDEHGLGFFDGTHLYEHADPRQGFHPDWGTYVFNYGRNEVRQFLISNAIFWLDKYHIDGLRVDAVASLLYLDFSRKAGEWVPNVYGGRENIDAIYFIRSLNERVHANYPSALTIAEESTSFAGVTHPLSSSGLGFDFKWNMGWMHDTLQYMSNDPIYRAFHHGTMTFSLLYAFSEKFLLPFSHDEVVHLKKSMLDKMPGDVWRKFANLRLLYGYQYSHPGKKMLFMGGEFGQWHEWTEKYSLDWHLLDGDPKHKGLQDFVRNLNRFYRAEPAFYEDDDSWNGFTWLDLHDYQRSILAFARHGRRRGETIIVACNFTPVVREGYRLGVPFGGTYQEVLNSDAAEYGGSGLINSTPLLTAATPLHGQEQALTLTLPPLAVVFLKYEREEEPAAPSTESTSPTP